MCTCIVSDRLYDVCGPAVCIHHLCDDVRLCLPHRLPHLRAQLCKHTTIYFYCYSFRTPPSATSSPSQPCFLTPSYSQRFATTETCQMQLRVRQSFGFITDKLYDALFQIVSQPACCQQRSMLSVMKCDSGLNYLEKTAPI